MLKNLNYFYKHQKLYLKTYGMIIFNVKTRFQL